VINLLRLLHVDPGVALQRAGAKFERRFREMERRLAESNVEVTRAGMDRLDAEWNLIKADEAAAEASGDQGASGDQEAPETGEPNASK
jgi:uncharacterized protein YabN with tetrapyrrole methylase and pyrophosphatase domain